MLEFGHIVGPLVCFQHCEQAVLEEQSALESDWCVAFHETHFEAFPILVFRSFFLSPLCLAQERKLQIELAFSEEPVEHVREPHEQTPDDLQESVPNLQELFRLPELLLPVAFKNPNQDQFLVLLEQEHGERH